MQGGRKFDRCWRLIFTGDYCVISVVILESVIREIRDTAKFLKVLAFLNEDEHFLIRKKT
jgi:hypothetical protein